MRAKSVKKRGDCQTGDCLLFRYSEAKHHLKIIKMSVSSKFFDDVSASDEKHSVMHKSQCNNKKLSCCREADSTACSNTFG